MDPGILLGIFIAWPALALLPAALLGFLYLLRRHRLLLVSALLWLAYGLYEYGMKLRILCSGECNIRVDLLLIYPVLVLLTVASVALYFRAQKGAGTKGTETR